MAAKKSAAKASAARKRQTVRSKPPGNRTRRGRGMDSERDADGCLAGEATFVLEYLKDNNAAQAAIRAGYSARTAKVAGCKMLARPHVKAAIERRSAALMATLEINAERVLLEFARIAFFDMRKAFDERGKLKSVHELDANTAAALASVETIGLMTDKVKAHAKHQALDALAKHLGLFKEDNKQKGDAIAALLQEVGERGLGLPVKG